MASLAELANLKFGREPEEEVKETKPKATPKKRASRKKAEPKDGE